ncbi:hypothetical protein ACF0H5_023469 [Mactra antiquata]
MVNGFHREHITNRQPNYFYQNDFIYPSRNAPLSLTSNTAIRGEFATFTYPTSTELQITGTFTKVSRIVSTQVTASFVTTVYTTVTANTTVTSTTTRTTTLIPPAVTSSVTASTTVAHTDAFLNRVNLNAGDVALDDQIICQVQAGAAAAAANEFQITQIVRTLTSTLLPSFQCGSTTVTAG